MMKTEQPVKEIPQAASTPLWASLIATFFGIGNLRPGPGTWGSLAAALIWFAVSHGVPQEFQPAVLACLIVIAVGIGIPAATAVARTSGKKDRSEERRVGKE